MTEKPYDPQQIERVIAAAEAENANAAEALMAAVQLMVKSLARFRTEAPAFRERVGEECVREFATVEFNELVYEIQDSVPVAVRIFNSLMRDPDAPKGPAGE